MCNQKMAITNNYQEKFKDYVNNYKTNLLKTFTLFSISKFKINKKEKNLKERFKN